MASHTENLTNLERHRMTLEENVQKLRKSLNDWRLWELDYEALLEEVAELPSPPTANDLTKLHQGWEGMVMSKSETLEIIFGKAGKAHGPDKIGQLLSRRIDYVSQNVMTLEKQLATAESKLASATVVSQPDALDEEGLPITEIIEELDEDGNVLSHQLRTAGDAQPQVLEALQMAGVENLMPDGGSRAAAQPKTDGDTEMEDTEDAAQEPKSAKKGVSFAEDTKPGHNINAPPEPPTKTSSNFRRLEDLMQTAASQDEMDLSQAVVPVDESEANALLRREMLEYSMSEIGPVVAELTLQEGTDDEFDEDYEYSEEDEEDEDEDDDVDDVDHLGRSRRSVIDADYRERMMALEKKLGFKGYFATDDSDEDDETQVQDHGIGRISVSKTPGASAVAENIPEVTKTKAPTGKQGVRFADELDVAPADVTPVYDPLHGQVKTSTEHNAEPLSDVVERGTSKPTTPINAELPTTKRVSRFKKDRVAPSDLPEAHAPIFPHGALPIRTANSSGLKRPAGPLEAPTRFLDQPRPSRPAPTGPDGQTLANQVVERDAAPGSAVEPDELEAGMMHREVNEEYHRRRNRMIMKEGGFGEEEEQAIERIEAVDEDEEPPRRVSRFKAARLG